MSEDNTEQEPEQKQAQTQEEPLKWDELLGVPKPPCCNMRAACCSVAVPSIPVKEMLSGSAEGQETCRDLMNCFIPHESHDAARAFYHEQPDHIDRVLKLVAAQSTKTQQDVEDVVFYHCRYLGEDRMCQVYEDRPTFCRDYPVSPMAILVKGCGYEPWVDGCKSKLRELGYEIAGGE